MMIGSGVANASITKVRGVPDTECRTVPHRHLIDALKKRAVQVGVASSHTPRFSLTRGGADLAASLPMKHPTPAGFTPHLGLAVSMARRHGLTFYAGAVHDETGTPIVVGRLDGGTKKSWMYGPDFDLAGVVDSAIRWWQDAAYKIGVVAQIVEGRRIWDLEVRELLYQCGREDIVPWKYIGKIDRLWRERGFSNRHNTAWDLCECIGQVFNRMTLAPMSQMERLYRFYAKVTTLKMVA